MMGFIVFEKIELHFCPDNFQTPNASIVSTAIRQSFNRWSSVSPFKFRDVTGIKEVIPDILIGFFSKCHGDPDCFDGPLHVLAHAYYPDDGELHFDLDESWIYPGSDEARANLLQ